MNKEEKEILVYIVIAVLLVLVGFKFVKPEFVKFQRNQKQISKIAPEIDRLEKQVKINQAKLKAMQAVEKPKTPKTTKKLFTIDKISNAQDNTSIILDKIFYIAKKNNVQLLEIDHSANEHKEITEIKTDTQTTKELKKVINKLGSQAEKIAADLTQKDLEYYQIDFLFSSSYTSMKAFLTELLQTDYYIKIDSIKSAIQKGRRSTINTDIKLSILLKRRN